MTSLLLAWSALYAYAVYRYPWVLLLSVPALGGYAYWWVHTWEWGKRS